MNGPAALQDIGAFINTKAGGGKGASITAAGAGDATEINTEWIDRQGYDSCSVFICGNASIGASETLDAIGNLQDASDSSGTGAADFGDAIASTEILAGAVTNQGFAKKLGDFDLRGADQYIRAQVTPDLSRSATDTAQLGIVIVLGGADTLPAA